MEYKNHDLITVWSCTIDQLYQMNMIDDHSVIDNIGKKYVKFSKGDLTTTVKISYNLPLENFNRNCCVSCFIIADTGEVFYSVHKNTVIASIGNEIEDIRRSIGSSEQFIKGWPTRNGFRPPEEEIVNFEEVELQLFLRRNIDFLNNEYDARMEEDNYGRQDDISCFDHVSEDDALTSAFGLEGIPWNIAIEWYL